jgi:F0F1-type ATP synthase assembly protein I
MIFANITGWIVAPVVLALILGKYLDKRFLTAPWFFLGLTIAAFFVTIFGILRLLKRYLKEMEEDKKK